MIGGARFPRWRSANTRAVPIQQIGAQTIHASYLTDTINGQALPLGVVPLVLPRCHIRAVRLWVISDTAESGADGSNHTAFEFRIGDTGASYTSLGTLTTENNPVAGEPMSRSISFRPKQGQGIYCVVTRNGTAVNFGQAGVSLGVEFHQERFS